MEFIIERTITVEYSWDLLKVSLNDLEDFISKNLENKDYGLSVDKFVYGFELFKFNGSFAQFFKDKYVEIWRHSVKSFITNSSFDWELVKDFNEIQTLKLIQKEIVSSINRIDNMKRKPKDFDYKRFALDINLILSEYIKSASL